MPRFQLLVRELGKEPRVVPLGDPIVVGRSRSADLTVDDEEVGRKQFQIGVTSGFVVLEGLGATNPTRVDDGTIQSGEKTTLPVGAMIRVGKTEFVIESTDKTEGIPAPSSPHVDQTMVAGGPGPGGAGPGGDGAGGDGAGAQPAAEPDPAPMNTMEFRPPGVGAPGAAPPSAPPPDEAPMNTMEFRPPGVGGPGAGGPPAGGAAPPPAGGEENYDQTMAKGFRPGQFAPGGATPPAETPPAETPPAKSPPAKTPPAKAPPAQPPKATAPQPAPAQPAAPQPAPPRPDPEPEPEPQPAAPPKAGPATPDRPKTVAVRPEDLAAVPGAPLGDDLESRLHQSMPRLFVKGEGLKRPVRLMKSNNRVGRAETADVLLPHESVSEQHAEIRFDGELWTLHDSGSTNGTIVDGQHLRGGSQVLRRNALIGIGALKLIFLCIDRRHEAQDRRDEERALQLLGRSGRIDRGTANEIRQMVRSDAHQSIAEIVLRDTPMSPTDWANAVVTARSKVSLLQRLLRLFSFGKR
jgi:pSer/pThr/pTyr-binding forkhead associated (FHA) protein